MNHFLKRLAIIFMLLLLFQSCYKEHNEYIDKDTWFLFNEGDTLLFNGLNSNDAFIIKDIDSFMGSFGTGINREVLFITYEYLEDTNEFLRINRYPNTVDVWWIDSLNCSVNYSTDEYFTYIIDNYTFDSVYYKEPGYKPENYIEQTIYYTDRYGVIAYENADGELFELDLNYLP